MNPQHIKENREKMAMKTLFKTFIAVVVYAMQQVSPVNAAAISVNIDSNAPEGIVGAVGTNTAGVVPVAGWNDVLHLYDGEITLKDSAGNATALKLKPALISTCAGSDVDFGAGKEGDTAMMRGLDYEIAPNTIDQVFTGKIPYAFFDIYVYYHSGAVTNTQTFSILDSDGGDLGLARVGYEVPGMDTDYVLSNGTNNANYVKFMGLSSDSVPENFIIRSAGPFAYLNGLQIIETTPVPEPTTTVLLITGMLGLLAHSGKKRK